MTFSDRLEALLREATEGPWVEDDGFIHSKPLSAVVDEWIRIKVEEKREPDFERPITVVASCEENWPRFQENAALICFLVSHAPALLAVVKAAQGMQECYDSEEHQAQQHADGCPLCELRQALRKLEAGE